jgi:hypothetical protein
VSIHPDFGTFSIFLFRSSGRGIFGAGRKGPEGTAEESGRKFR